MDLYRLFEFFVAGTFTQTVTPTGGSEFGGGDTVFGSTSSFSGSGGTEFGSMSGADITWNPASIGAEGGTEFGGTGATIKQAVGLLGDGGVEFGGSSSHFEPIWGRGGFEFGGGSSVFGATITGITATGGTEFGGTDTTFAIGPVNTFTMTMSGGTEFSGGATFGRSVTQIATGGTEFGGSSSVLHITLSMLAGPGGSEFGGSKTLFGNEIPSLEGTGGTEFGGDDSSFTGHATFAGVGGTEFGGANSVFSIAVSPLATGGTEFGGSDTVFAILLSQIPEGGTEFGGSAALGVGLISYGGFEFGGSGATQNAGFVIPGSGGIEFGGSASLFGIGIIPTGGVEFGGDGATFGRVLAAAMSGGGGTEFGGIATVTISRADPTTGGTGVPVVISTPYHRGPTTRRNVIEAIRRTLIATGQWTEDQVLIPRRRDEQDLSPPSEPFLALFLGTNQVQQPDFSGGGLFSDTRIEVLEVRVYNRLEYDQMQRATSWELDASTGTQRWVLLVSNALHGEEAFDGAGVCTTGQPMRILDIRDQQPSRQQGWGYVPIFVEVLYTAAETSA